MLEDRLVVVDNLEQLLTSWFTPQNMDESSEIPDVSLVTGHLRPTYRSSEVDRGVFVSYYLKTHRQKTFKQKGQYRDLQSSTSLEHLTRKCFFEYSQGADIIYDSDCSEDAKLSFILNDYYQGILQGHWLRGIRKQVCQLNTTVLQVGLDSRR